MLEQVHSIVTLLLKRPITQDIALRVGAFDEFNHLEVVNGEWVGLEGLPEEMTGEEHGHIEFKFILALGNHVVENKLGRLYPGDVDFVLDGEPDDIRLKREADVAFVQTERVQKTTGYFYGAPDLAIEIVSPTQYRPEMLSKAAEYLQHGTQEVWLVFPREQQIEVHRPDRAPKIYGVGDTIPGGDLLPGFELAVAAVFDV